MHKRSFILMNCVLLLGALALNANAQTWNNTGALGTARSLHTATLLTNGKVLVVGGFTPDGQVTATAELYDPATGQWSATNSPGTPRVNHIAVRLLNGKVLIASGGNGQFGVALTSAELYDPDTGNWSAAANLNVGRGVPKAILLADGKVLVVGGAGSATAEVYDPANNMWRSTGPMNSVRLLHTVTLLPDGRALTVGGNSTSATLRSAEVYNPASNNWTLTGQLSHARQVHAAVSLSNGQVLVSGGAPAGNNPFLTQAELYDPASGQWSATGSMTTPRANHTLTLLPNGNVLAAAGSAADSGARLRNAELYNPATGNWAATADLNATRTNHTATLLSNGKVLVAAGSGDSGQINTAELYGSAAPALASVSAASFAAGGAPESIIAAFGVNLAASVQAASSTPLPTELAGVSVRIRDSAGVERLAPLFFVSPQQINYLIPAGTATGAAQVNISSGAAGVIEITNTAPGLFAANANGQGIAAALALRVRADGSLSYEPVARLDGGGFVAAPIDLGPESDQVFLILYGTGLRQRSSQGAVSCRLGSVTSEVLFAAAAPDFTGLDQVNVRISRSLAGRGEVSVEMNVDGRSANVVRVNIR
jgi:uncharacterized protein (TIGR03437 family)